MKIVVFVDYSNAEFNKDFALSNALLERGHQVFLVSNNEQLQYYVSGGMDKLIRGYSASNVHLNLNCFDAHKHTIEEVVEGI